MPQAQVQNLNNKSDWRRLERWLIFSYASSSTPHPRQSASRQSFDTSVAWSLRACLIGSYAHLLVKIIPLGHFDASIDGIILNLGYQGEKAVLQLIFCRR